MRGRARRGRASALIFVLGVLALVSLLAATLSVQVRLERLAAETYLMGVRADLAAWSGLEAARARLADSSARSVYLDLHGPWAARGPEGTPLGVLHPLEEEGLVPSFAVQSSWGAEVSGEMPGVGRTHYLLKVLDGQGLLDLNGREPHLAAMLEHLGRAIADEHGVPDPVPPGEGAALVAAREALPGRRFAGKAQLRALVGAARFALLRDFVTVHARTDYRTVRPAPDSPLLVPGLLASEPRPPVNLNTASVPVLAACLTGLAGKRWMWVPQGQPVRGTPPATLQEVPVRAIDYGSALSVARALDARRRGLGPFLGWGALRAFLTETASGPLAALEPAQIELILANADPSVHALGADAPGAPPRAVGKLRLTYHTTEFCFTSGGRFEVESLGRVLDAQGEVAAEARVARVVQVLRGDFHRTQREFERAGRDEQGNPLYLGVQTGPESVAARGVEGASPHEGWVALSTELSPGVDATSTFHAPYRETLDAESAAGEVAAGGDQDPAIPLRAGGHLGPDGVLAWSDPTTRRTLSYRSEENVPFETGAAGLWVRLHLPPDSGSDESLVYCHVPDPAAGGAGTVWRLERYGRELVSTRFIHGYPGDQVQPYPRCFTEAVFDISGWRAGEWHHVAHLWWSAVDQALYVDGERAVRYFYLKSEEPMTRQVIALRSHEAAARLGVAGYGFQAAGSGTIFRSFDLVPGPVQRFANATLDDLRFWTFPGPFEFSEAEGFLPPSRYLVATTEPGTYRGRFPLGEDAHRVLGLRYDLEMPAYWSGHVLGPDEIRVGLRVRPSGEAPWIELNPGGSPLAAAGYSMDLPVTPLATFEYEFRIAAPTAVLPFNVTPVLREVQLLVLERGRDATW